MKIVRLNKKTKTLITKLLKIQEKARECDNTKVLNNINIILFNINEKWRNAMLKVNNIDYLDKGYKTIINATCYKF